MIYLVLDFDGTIAWLRVDWKHVRSELERRYSGLKGKPIFTWLQERFLRGLDVEGPMEVIREAEFKAMGDLDFDEELVELLHRLRARGARMALVSMQDDDVLRRALEKMGLEGVFDVVIGRRTELIRERQLSLVLDTWGIRPSQALFISDRIEDIEVGLRMGLRALRLFYLDGSVKKWLKELLAGPFRPPA